MRNFLLCIPCLLWFLLPCAGAATAPAGWQLVWSDEPPPQPGQKVSKKKAPAPMQVLGFTLDELKEARLAPIVDFKGRKRAGVQEQGK